MTHNPLVVAMDYATACTAGKRSPATFECYSTQYMKSAYQDRTCDFHLEHPLLIEIVDAILLKRLPGCYPDE